MNGFSFGGRTALWSAMTRFQDSYGGSELVAHVAFYPSTCFIQLEGETDVGDAPIWIFHGTEDDWTPIDQCQDFVGRLAAAGVDAALNAYPGAHHSSDDETLPHPLERLESMLPALATVSSRRSTVRSSIRTRVASPASARPVSSSGCNTGSTRLPNRR